MPTSDLRTNYKRKPRKCPNCGSSPVASIFYGMPNIASDLFEKEERGEVVFGGCVIFPDGEQPSWHCTSCKTDFFRTI